MREKIDLAIGDTLFHVTNYPEFLQRYVLGRDMSKLRESLVEAVMDILENMD